VLPSVATAKLQKSREQVDVSREKVRVAAQQITRIAGYLHEVHLDQYLPTTGVTVLLPAIIIHLLDMKASNVETRQAALADFKTCMHVLDRLRQNYPAAEFATGFLEAAIQKAGLVASTHSGLRPDEHRQIPTPIRSSVSHVNQLLDVSKSYRMTPPPDDFGASNKLGEPKNDNFFLNPFAGRIDEPQRQVQALASTPPDQAHNAKIVSRLFPGVAPTGTLQSTDVLGVTNFGDSGFGDFFDFEGAESAEGLGTGLDANGLWADSDMMQSNGYIGMNTPQGEQPFMFNMPNGIDGLGSGIQDWGSSMGQNANLQAYN